MLKLKLLVWTKSLRSCGRSLDCIQTKGLGVGWGICFDEGLNWFMVLVLGSTGLLLSMVFGLLWTCLRDDMQGGFGVAACMMMTFMYTAGMLQAASM